MSSVMASAVLGSAIVLDVVATALLVRSDVATTLQKTLQIIFIWLVPFFGAIMVIALLREVLAVDRDGGGTDASSSGWLAGMGPEIGDSSAHHHGHGAGTGDGGHSGDAGS